MFVCVVEVNNKKIRLIFPHKCGSSTFSNLIRSGYFDVPLISTNDMDTPTEEIHVYGRNPYRKAISSFFQMKLMSDRNIDKDFLDKIEKGLDYGERPTDEKVDEFRNFISKTKKVWEQYGLIENHTKDFPAELGVHYNHIKSTCVDIFGCVWKNGEYDPFNIPKHMEEIKDEIIFYQLEDVRSNFILKNHWKKSTDSFKPFDDFGDYLDKYKAMRQDTDQDRYQHHVYYNSTNMLRKSPYHIFYDEETMRSVNWMFEIDFKFFNYPKCKSIYDIKKFTGDKINAKWEKEKEILPSGHEWKISKFTRSHKKYLAKQAEKGTQVPVWGRR
tara:strand:+ start:1030 stop:2013 length:984 start_codon:yes stop_codon:yes gene_type:complete